MKKVKVIIISLMFILISFNVLGQVNIKLELSKRLYVQYEKIYAKVTLRNDTGNTIIFGSNEALKGSIDFVIENKKQEPIFINSDTPLPKLEGIILKPNGYEMIIVCLNNHYSLQRRGKYRIKATFKHRRIPFRYRSEILPFEISKGITMWEQTVGIPQKSENGNNMILQRTFRFIALQEIKRKYFYLVVEDDKHVYNVALLGEETGVQIPIFKFDIYNNLHILLKINPRIFSYMKFNITGHLEQQAVYQVKGTINIEEEPNTKEIIVTGGVLAPKQTYDQILREKFSQEGSND